MLESFRGDQPHNEVVIKLYFKRVVLITDGSVVYLMALPSFSPKTRVKLIVIKAEGKKRILMRIVNIKMFSSRLFQ